MKSAAVFLAIICTLLWGTAFPFIKLGYSAFDIRFGDLGAMLLFAGCRFFLAGLVILPFMAVRCHGRILPQRADMLPIALLGLVMTAAQYLFIYIGLGFTSGANTSIITACASFFTVLAAPFFFRGDKLTWLKVCGCALGIGGVLLMNNGGGMTQDTVFGDLMVLLSTICAAAGNLLTKRIASDRNPVLVTAYQLLFGGGLLVFVGLACGGRINFWNSKGILILLWLVFVSAAAFAIWTSLLKYHPASRVSVFILLVPVFGTALSGVLLDENIWKTETLFSLILIAAGILLVNISPKEKTVTSEVSKGDGDD